MDILRGAKFRRAPAVDFDKAPKLKFNKDIYALYISIYSRHYYNSQSAVPVGRYITTSVVLVLS